MGDILKVELNKKVRSESETSLAVLPYFFSVLCKLKITVFQYFLQADINDESMQNYDEAVLCPTETFSNGKR